eukprot:gnl/TRDRNA2_/TRDRNA2_60604_c0_seq1.p1 gnl/TRDRNA2_/TRDRNA2_60604_c0~~gnl/TRDRNA2_/TRDRNA2_60604_c0_seq1.p1  ORF type:complete len:265 (-),score=41.07 gnl/TRDRNA2_/TRDRNA2_60604_c0_seq1:53-847(-)
MGLVEDAMKSAQPSKTFLFALSLYMGVLVICAITLLIQITIIAFASSSSPITISYTTISPWLQTLVAAWSFVGMVPTIGAGVAALYMMDKLMWMFIYYLVISWLVGLVFPIYFVLYGNICNLVSTPGEKKWEANLVCASADVSMAIVVLVCLICHAYAIYIVWSMTKHIEEKNAEFTARATMRYSEAIIADGVATADGPPEPEYRPPRRVIGWLGGDTFGNKWVMPPTAFEAPPQGDPVYGSMGPAAGYGSTPPFMSYDGPGRT